ncbi:diguanylate cyclase, partial [Vibrio sp. M260118]|uniref:diguanylate cyclase n=1 Tax=Vibrio sp. M260118 TaxID=3020896 RepID=UPI002F41734C
VGGEEFAVVLSDLSFNRSIAIAEAICSAIRNIDFECLDKDPNRVTVSLGCAYYAHADLTQSLNDADHLMYQSKLEGKNRVSAKAFV